MFWRCGFWILSALLLFEGGFAQRRTPRERNTLPSYFRAFQSYDLEENLTRVVFKNGLVLLVEEHPEAPLACLVTIVKLGYLESGLSQGAVELMARSRRLELEKGLQDLGGSSRSWVGPYETTYSSVFASQYFDDVLALHGRLIRPFESGELGPERRHREPGEPPVNPLKRAEGRLLTLMEANGRSSAAVIEPSPLTVLGRRYYHPGNVVLAISGSVQREKVLREAVDLFGGVPPLAEGVTGTSTASFSGAGKFRYKSETCGEQQPLILFGAPIPGSAHRDFPVLQLLGYVLNEGNSALFKLPDVAGEMLKFSAEIRMVETPRGGAFVIVASTEIETIDQAEVQILAQLAVLSRVVLHPSILDRAKAMMLVDYYRGMEKLPVRAYRLAHGEAQGDFRNRDLWPQRVLDIKGGDLKRVAAEYLGGARTTVLECLPQAAEERTFTPESFQESLEILLPVRIEARLGVVESLKGDAEGTEPLSLPPFQPGFSVSKLRKSSILRGPEIFLREREAVPLVHLGFFFAGGRINETPQNMGISELLIGSILQELRRRDDGVAMHRLEELGCRIETVVEPDFMGLSASVLSPSLNAVMATIVDWWGTIELDEKDLVNAKAELMRGLAMKPEPLGTLLRREAKHRLFTDHPYGFEVGEVPVTLPGFELDEVNRWRRRHLENVHPYIVVVGDVDGTGFLQGLISKLSHSRYRVAKAPERDVEFAENEDGSSVITTVASDGRLILAIPGPPEGSGYEEMLDVAIRMLGGARGLLYQELVENKGIAEGVRIQRQAGVAGGAILIEIQGDPGKLAQAGDSALAVLRGFSEASIPVERFRRAVIGTITDSYFRQLDSDRYVPEIMRMMLAGERVDYAARYVRNLKQVRLGEVESALHRFVGSK